uniref:Uncharacterized protein n=1 Tax=Caenorhabditis japonica TaxID=281687 RepID=A0A8R1DTJ0_CAEJA
MKLLFFIVVLVAFGTLQAAKKQKQAAKVIYVEKVPPKTPSEYDLCKQECRIQRDAQSTKDRVEQIRQELAEAEALLAEHNKNVDAPEIPEERRAQQEHEVVPTLRKASRYEYLKRAASKIVESGSELRHAVTGEDDVI